MSATQQGLIQQGYDYSPSELRELSWGLRFTPTVCMVGAAVGLATRQPWIHFTLAALGILPFWFPAAHPVDVLYNRLLRPLWNGVVLPPNPLPRRIACLMGGTMNLGIGLSFLYDALVLAYVLGAALIGLQLIVISTHFCVASWMYEMLLRLLGRWTAPVPPERARELLDSGAVLVDVRNPDEFARGHLPGACNIPLEDVARALTGKEQGCYVVYCQSGLRSQAATQILKRRGHGQVYNLGSMSRLETEGESQES